MAQHPRKLEWRERISYGISASQFGMALGLCGRVIDYVNYLRNIIGTDMEFVGNEFTNHGIVTEDKSRSLYEILTGSRVFDGGFFVTDDYVLGCSPDGRIILCDCDPELVLSLRSKRRSSSSQTKTSSSSTQESSISSSCSSSPSQASPLASQRSINESSTSPLGSDSQASTKRRFSISVPFGKKSKVQPSSQESMPSSNDKTLAEDESFHERHACAACRHPVRLLEIKSPFRSLYDGSKRGYEPFGIPQHYMCQMQGQMAIAGADECDFFVFLDGPTTEVVAWRVRRSAAFWDWAMPKLRQVSAWVRDGPPEWLNRSFEFEPFDYRTLEVVPLVFPFNVSLGIPLRDEKRFGFFESFLGSSKSVLVKNGIATREACKGNNRPGQRTMLFSVSGNGKTGGHTNPLSTPVNVNGSTTPSTAMDTIAIHRSFDEAESRVCMWNGIESTNESESLDVESSCYKHGRLTSAVVREHREMYERLTERTHSVYFLKEPRVKHREVLRNVMEGLMHPITRALFSHPSFARLAALGISSETSDVIEAAEPVDPNAGESLVIEVRFKLSSQMWETIGVDALHSKSSLLSNSALAKPTHEKKVLLRLIAANYTRGTVRFSLEGDDYVKEDDEDASSRLLRIHFHERDLLCGMIPTNWNPQREKGNVELDEDQSNVEITRASTPSSPGSESIGSSSLPFRVVSPSKVRHEKHDGPTPTSTLNVEEEEGHSVVEPLNAETHEVLLSAKEGAPLDRPLAYDAGETQVYHEEEQGMEAQRTYDGEHVVLVEQTPPDGEQWKSANASTSLTRYRSPEARPSHGFFTPRTPDRRPVVILVEDSQSPSLQRHSSVSRSVSPHSSNETKSNDEKGSTSSDGTNGKAVDTHALKTKKQNQKQKQKRHRSEAHELSVVPEYVTISSSPSTSRCSVSPPSRQECNPQLKESSREELMTQVPLISADDVVSFMQGGRKMPRFPLPDAPHDCCGVALLPALNSNPQFFLKEGTPTSTRRKSVDKAVPSSSQCTLRQRRVLLVVSRGVTLEYLLYKLHVDPFREIDGDDDDEDSNDEATATIHRNCSEDFPVLVPSSMRDVARTLRQDLQEILGPNSSDPLPMNPRGVTAKIRFSTFVRFFDHILFCLVESPNQRSVRVGPSQCGTVVVLVPWDDMVAAIESQCIESDAPNEPNRCRWAPINPKKSDSLP